MMKPLLATVAALAMMSGVALAADTTSTATTTDTNSWVSQGPNVAAAGNGEHTSTLCHFNSGPRAGQTQDYAPQHAAAVGLPCHDGKESNGLIIAQ